MMQPKNSILRCFCLPVLLFAWLFPISGVAQQRYRQIPEAATRSIPLLSAALASGIDEDSMKVRNFYFWLARHFSYDTKAIRVHEWKNKFRKIDELLRSRKAVCLGYARVFKALCEEVDIPCEIISGYSKNRTSFTSKITEPDHAWNAVQIDSTWYLLDATWGSTGTTINTYFLTDPKVFILDHLPADPMWQLLNCPITPEVFQSTESKIKQAVKTSDTCFYYQDSLVQFFRQAPEKRKLQSAKKSYDFLPSPANQKELGHAYFDYLIVLSEREEALRQNDSITEAIALQEQILDLADLATKHSSLYDWQLENIANHHINYAVSLSRFLGEQETSTQEKTLKQMDFHLKTAKKMLEELPVNFLLEQNLHRCEEYLNYTRQYLH